MKNIKFLIKKKVKEKTIKIKLPLISFSLRRKNNSLKKRSSKLYGYSIQGLGTSNTS